MLQQFHLSFVLLEFSPLRFSGAGCVNVPLPTARSALLWLSCSKPAESRCQDLSAFCARLPPTLNAASVPATAAVISASAGSGSKFSSNGRWTLPRKPDSGPTGAGQTNQKVNDQRSNTAAAARTRHSGVPPGTTCLRVARCTPPAARVTGDFQYAKWKWSFFTGTLLLLPQLIIWVHVFEGVSAHHPLLRTAGLASLSQSCDTARPRPLSCCTIWNSIIIWWGSTDASGSCGHETTPVLLLPFLFFLDWPSYCVLLKLLVCLPSPSKSSVLMSTPSCQAGLLNSWSLRTRTSLS